MLLKAGEQVGGNMEGLFGAQIFKHYLFDTGRASYDWWGPIRWRWPGRCILHPWLGAIEKH